MLHFQIIIWISGKDFMLPELRYYKMNNQICIVNQEVLEQILIFQESYEVKERDAR